VALVGITQQESVVPEVRNDVGAEDLEESKLVDRVVQGDSPEDSTDIRDDDLPPLARREHHGAGVEIWGRGVRSSALKEWKNGSSRLEPEG